jgi:ribonuclease P protein component
LKNDHGYHRFAVSVNRKIGNSVERNFIKRKMKELFRANKHLVTGKHDLWIVMKSCFEKKNSREVEEVEGLFIQALKKMDRIGGHKGKQHR